MKKLNNVKKNGFTLVELLVVIGIAALSVIAIYTAYSKKQTTQTVNTQSIYLEQITQSISNIFSSSDNLALLTPTNVISSRAVPEQLIESPTVIKNLFGGDIQFTNVSVTPPIYGIVLSSVPGSACALLSTSNFANLAQEVLVNGISVKTAGAVVNAATVATIAGVCNNDTNTVEFRNQVERISDIPIVSALPVRPKENPYYIATIGAPVASPAVACTGGTAWNGSMCSCPAGNQWDGTNCIPYGSKAGACALGQAWNGAACAAIGGPGEVYLSGRAVPNLGYGTIQQSAAGKACVAAGGNFDGTTCQTCTNGAWNGFRCVTP